MRYGVVFNGGGGIVFDGVCVTANIGLMSRVSVSMSVRGRG